MTITRKDCLRLQRNAWNAKSERAFDSHSLAACVADLSAEECEHAAFRIGSDPSHDGNTDATFAVMDALRELANVKRPAKEGE